MEPIARHKLSKERILDRADELLVEGRPITMRSIAERLGVTPMAIYKWFANKDELLDALTERIAVATLVIDDGPWDERALRFAASIRSTLLLHLPLLQIEGAGRRLAASMYRTADEGLRLMLEIGYRDQAAVDHYRVLFWSVLNHCLVIDAGGALPGGTTPDEITKQVTQREGDPWTDVPTLAAHLSHFGTVEPDAFFDATIHVVIAGILAGAPTPRPSA